MKRLIKGIALLAIGTVVACVTINIYFPAEEIRGVADRIVDEVYGEPAKPVTTPPAQPGSSFYHIFVPTTAYAAQDLDVTTPEIRAIREDMKTRFEQLTPYLDSGQVGITRDGLLEVRTCRWPRYEGACRSQPPGQGGEPGSLKTLQGNFHG